MTSPALANDSILGRLYRKPDTDPSTLPDTYEAVAEGLLMPSVTNVIGILEKPFLRTWYAKLAAEAAVQVNTTHPGLMESRPEKAVGWLKDAAVRSMAQSGATGDEVHNALELIAAGHPAPKVSPDSQLFINSFDRFVTDFQPEFLRLEATCFGEVQDPDRELPYAGTADFTARINNKIVVGDYKSGRSVHTEASLQLTALARADHIIAEDGVTLEEMPHIDGGVVLHLTRTGYTLHPVPITPDNWETFSGLRRVWDFHTRNLAERNPLGILPGIRKAADLAFANQSWDY